MDDPEPLTPNADASAIKEYEMQLLRAQPLLRNMMTMPTRSGGVDPCQKEKQTPAFWQDAPLSLST
jgi:hypothetical protein